MGSEDDDEVPERQRQRLHSVLERRTRFQCHHSQKQVNPRLSKPFWKQLSVIYLFGSTVVCCCERHTRICKGLFTDLSC